MHFYVGEIAMRTSAEATVVAATVVVVAALCRRAGASAPTERGGYNAATSPTAHRAVASTSQDYRSQSS